MTNDTRKAAILAALHKFIEQRPGMDPRNYASAASYRQEYREVLRDKHDAERLLRELELRGSITADDILREAGSGGRLTIKDGGIGSTVTRAEYTTGQAFWVEYRKAVAQLAAAVLWAHVREHGMPAPENRVLWQDGSRSPRMPAAESPAYVAQRAGKAERGEMQSIETTHEGLSAGDWLRAYFKREFGRHLAARYFT